MSAPTRSLPKSLLLSCAATIALGSFATSPAARADDQAGASENGMETIVVTGTRFNTDAAPAKASLDTVEPQTIINKSYIDNFVPATSDYVTILAIVPGLTGGDSDGPGLSDGGAKNTLRGMSDGQFVIQYDGIPFGDTNGPTHHNISYFPASTIGSIAVDRGPGNAGNMGAATFGGTIKFFSRTLDADPNVSAALTYGSFDTGLAVLNGQSGDLEAFGTTTRVMVNLQGLESNGALSDQDVSTYNALLKVQTQIGDNWTFTGFTDYSYLREHLDDNNGLTPAQVAAYGKDFALQNTNPLLPTYYAYNYTTKGTDLDYFRIQGDIVDGVKLDNTNYTYAYYNHTFSPNSQLQTSSQILADTSANNGTVTLLNGTKIPNQQTAYDKVNRYRVYGDILRFSEDYDFGWLSGQVREGAWFETQNTHRYRFYFDANLCNSEGINPYEAGGGAAAAACGINPNVTTPSGAQVKSVFEPGLGYTSVDESSSWTQYQPFLEVDIKPTDDLTITPGFKYVHWIHGVDAPTETKNLCGIAKACPGFNGLEQNFQESYITRKGLPFLTVNYKLDPSWSVYAEYAKGIYVPDISTFEQKSITVGFPAAELTTNYQLGTVYYADNFTFDADVYYINIGNNYVSQACAPPLQNDSCFVNNGSAVYKGVEGEGTYAFSDEFGVDLTGLSLFVNGALMSSKATNGPTSGRWEPNAPKWTAAAGLLYKQNGLKLGLIAKITGPQYSDTANNSTYYLPQYSNVNFTAGYEFLDNYELDLNIDNLLDSRATLAVTEGGTGTSLATSTDQYIFQAPRAFEVTLKAHFSAASAPVTAQAAYVPPPVQAPMAAPKSYMVFFDFNKSDLTPQAVEIVDTAAKNAGPAKVTQLRVTGHTDTVGSDAYNMRLSKRRAESVAAQLEKDGIPSSEIEIVAKGKRDLLVPTKDGVKEPQNRRVQIVYDNGMTS
jgi:iron complex outermembrane receptor protein